MLSLHLVQLSLPAGFWLSLPGKTDSTPTTSGESRPYLCPRQFPMADSNST
jgi:hypothetical protein